MTASFRFSKTRQNGPFLAFLINFCPLKMMNETFSVIFKHRVKYLSRKYIMSHDPDNQCCTILTGLLKIEKKKHKNVLDGKIRSVYFCSLVILTPCKLTIFFLNSINHSSSKVSRKISSICNTALLLIISLSNYSSRCLKITEKVSFNIASEAPFTFWVDKS